MSAAFFAIATVAEADVFLQTLVKRANPAVEAGSCDRGEVSVDSAVAAILADVRSRGLEAVVEYTRRYDAPDFTEELFRVPVEELSSAAASIPDEDARIIAQAMVNIREYHEAQKGKAWFLPKPDGSIFGQMVSPVDRAGLYVPAGQGGSTPLISSLLMGAIPAQVAGVQEIVVASPPMSNGRVNTHILAAAYMLGLTEVYAAGSAWAVAALAYGAGGMMPVDVIAGPGNIYVTTAKRMLIGSVGIDMIAGPSEVCIVADSSANPAWVAADMLSQAEHDRLASAICLCTDPGTAQAVAAELSRQCELLPRKDIAQASLSRYGAVIAVPDLDTALELANRIAPEHLELLLASPWEALPRIRHAGAVFLGHYSPEVVGDYYGGPNHVLPTMGTARFSSALSVDTFCKKTSVVAASRGFTAAGAKAMARLARLEGLEGHAISALCRLEKE